MTHEKQKTALHQLIEMLELKKQTAVSSHLGCINMCIDMCKELLELEKEQISEAYYIGDKNGCGCYDFCTKEDSEQYFKEKFIL